MTSELHTNPKLSQFLPVTLLLFSILLLSACNWEGKLNFFSSGELVAIAFPEELSLQTVQDALARHGISGSIKAEDVQVPLTDFVRLDYLPVSDLPSRVKADDPRNTPLSSMLVSTFSATRADQTWRIWYIPIAGNEQYGLIENAFTEIGCEWAWDAQPEMTLSPFVWPVLLGWILWLMSGKRISNRLFHFILVLPWFPLLLCPGLTAAAILIVGQGISTIIGIQLTNTGYKKRLTLKDLARLSGFLFPFLVSLLVLVAIDRRLILPVTVVAILLVLAVVFKDTIVHISLRKHLHRLPTFRLILKDTLAHRIKQIGVSTVVPLTLLLMLTLIVPTQTDGATGLLVVFENDRDTNPDFTDLIQSHIRYQEALAWGRLGDAAWMEDNYTLPYRYTLQDGRIVREEVPEGGSIQSFSRSPERDLEVKRILDHTGGASPSVVLSADIPRIRPIQLDSQGVLFYIMAMAPFGVLVFQKVSQSRRRLTASYTNRQVA